MELHLISIAGSDTQHIGRPLPSKGFDGRHAMRKGVVFENNVDDSEEIDFLH